MLKIPGIHSLARRALYGERNFKERRQGNELQQLPRLRFGLVFQGFRPEVALSSYS